MERSKPEAGVASPNLVLAIAAIGVVLATLDLFIVSLALPSIGRDFGGASLNDLSWIMNGYAITYAALLVFMGRLAERYRRDRSYLAGLALFILASAGCAVANGVWILVAFRVVQAAGAALMTPTSLALVLAAFEPALRSRAARIWTAIGGFAGAFGPVIGGILLVFGWQWIFIVNVPIGLIALVAGWKALPAIEGHDVPRPDALGALMVTLGSALLIFGFISAGDSGWSQPRAWGGVVAGLVLMAAFGLHCIRARNPLLEPALFQNRGFASAAIGLAPFMVAFGAFLLSFVLFQQQVWEWSALKTGLTLAPGPFLVPLTSMFVAGRLIDRFGAPRVIVLGLSVFAAATLIMVIGFSLSPSLPLALAAAMVSGVGVGLTLPTMMGAGAGALPPSSFATGSAALNMIRQLGMALGIAALVGILGEPSDPAAALSAFRLCWWFVLACTGLGIVPTMLIRQVRDVASQ